MEELIGCEKHTECQWICLSCRHINRHEALARDLEAWMEKYSCSAVVTTSLTHSIHTLRSAHRIITPVQHFV